MPQALAWRDIGDARKLRRLKDLPHAELHLLATGHFALEDQGDEIARLMRAFLDRTLPRS